MRDLPLYSAQSACLEIETRQAEPYDHECERCKLHNGVKTVCIPAEVTGPDAGETLLVLGTSPGVQEDKERRHFVSKAGRYLRSQVQATWQGPVVYDAAVRCALGKRKRNPSHAKSCAVFTAYTLQQAKPTRIICFGAEAIASILGRGIPAASARRGYAYTSTGIPVFFMPHPVAALQNRFIRAQFELDIVWSLTALPPGPPRAGIVLLPSTPEESREAVEDLRDAEWVTWDIETFGAMGDKEATVLNLAITPGGSDYAYVWDRAELLDEEVRRPVFDLLEDPSVVKVGHGLKFDCGYMRAVHGLDIRAGSDTMIMRRLYDGDVQLRLDYAQALVGCVGGKNEAHDQVAKGVAQLRKMVKKPEVTWRGSLYEPTLTGDEIAIAKSRVAQGAEPKRYAYAAIQPDTRRVYNAMDTISCDRIHQYQLAQGTQDTLPLKVWDDVAGDMNHALMRMEVNGVRADRATVVKLQEKATETMTTIMDRFTQEYRYVNFNAPADVAAFLFDELGLPSQGTTDSGQRQVTKEIMGRLKHPACADIIAYKKAAHFKSQYADGMAACIRDDGRVHPGFKVVGTTTGRPSCEDPNLLNIPRASSEEGKLARDILIADDGWLLLESDQSQVELRVAALLADDDVMLQVFLDGEDFHLATARMVAPMFGVDPATVMKDHPLRDAAKSINFGTLYGESAASLAKKLGVSKKRTEQLQDAILGKFHKLRDWIAQRLAYAKKHGHTYTYWNNQPFRRRLLTAIAEHGTQDSATAERSAWNTPVQGTAAEYTNASLWPIQDWIDKNKIPAKPCLTVYDSIVVAVREDCLEEVAHEVKTIMEGHPSGNMPLRCDQKVGHAWGSLEEYEAA